MICSVHLTYDAKGYFVIEKTTLIFKDHGHLEVFPDPSGLGTRPFTWES